VALLTHPGILAIYGFGEQDGSTYAVTELLEGQTLRDAIAVGPLAPRRAAEVALAVAQSLAYAHDRGIIHRDLKPENVFLVRDGRTKVLDFGLAAFVDTPLVSTHLAESQSPTRIYLTTPGAVLGTTDYLSPEQVRGEGVDERSDIFSIGSLLYEMLTARQPFRRETVAETMTAILREEPAALATPSVDISSALEKISRHCLQKKPGERFQSARELADAISGTMKETPAIPLAGNPGEYLHSPALRTFLSVVTIVIIGAIGAFGVWKARAPIRPIRAESPREGVNLTSIGEVPSPNAEANEYFEKGLLFLRAKLDIPRAQFMFDQAIELDPNFGSARAMRALTFVIAIHEGFSNDPELIYRAERDARNVISKQPGLASAHGTLGAALLYLNRKTQARGEFETALRIDPRSQPGAAWLAIDARHSGDFAMAEKRTRKILEAVPLFWAARIILSDILFEAGSIHEARREIEKVFEQDPQNLGAARAMARLRIYQGDTPGARRMLEGISASTHPNFKVRLLWALLLAREGKGAEAVSSLDSDLLKYAGIGMFAPSQIAEIYALAGKTDQALEWLDRGVRNGDERADWLRRDALFANVRDQPRFQLILGTIDLGRR
jgi:tetratricopeptide (TPR) repeat protein